MEAVSEAPDKSNSSFVIYIEGGVYRENVEIKKTWSIMMVGDGMGITVISGNRCYVDGWKQYSRTLFTQSCMGSVVKPDGWLERQGNFALSTLFYADGPGATLSSRVKWPGYHPITDPKEASNYTVGEFIAANLWLPSTGVKYSSGLAG